MSKILIIQPVCPHYRVPLFEKMAYSFRTSLIHYGNRKFINNELIDEIDLQLKKISSLKYIKNLSDECNKYDCIITVLDPHWLNSFFLPFLIKKPVIFWGHGVGRSKLVSYMRKVVGEKAKALITYDEEGKQKLIEIGLKPQKIFVAPNTIHISNSSNFAEEEKNSILYVGRLQKRKELDVLIKSFAKAHHNLPTNTILKILGDGEKILEYLNKLVSNLAIADKVEFMKGTTDEDELAEHFKTAYCYASPGAVGLGVLHSFAYGVPVITFKDRNHGPEVSNIKHNKNGLLVDGREQEFGESLVELINTGIFKKLGNNAYDHYSHNRTIAHMLEPLKEAIEYSIRE